MVSKTVVGQTSVVSKQFELTLRPWPSVSELQQALEIDRRHVGPWPKVLMERMPLVKDLTVVKLGLVTPRMLGASKCQSRVQIFRKIRANGLLLCHPQVGPELELAAPQDPDFENVRFAMEPLPGDPPGIFHRRAEGHRIGLYADAGGASVEFSDTSTWLVQIPD